MSRIIKGGNTKVFSFLLDKGTEEESFNPLKRLLPEEAIVEIERSRNEAASEIEDPAEENSPEEHEEALLPEEETLPEAEETSEPEEAEDESRPFDLAEVSLEELLQHPEISARLAHLEQEAYEKGFAQGQKDGEELGRRQYETLANRLKEILKSLEEAVSEHVLTLEPQLFSLLKVMVEKLVLKEVSTSPEVIKTCLREALGHVVEQTQVKIHLHPDDVEFLEEVLGELREEFARIRDFEILSDPNLSRGGCLLETEFGLIDATLDRRWREIFAKLEDESTKS
ncbi:MAG: hypothetical protein GXO20_03150 [Thermodesulfobacteria bacterium]|nr:hypothetical protein [Thermodesulfobacteriota bacterium]